MKISATDHGAATGSDTSDLELHQALEDCHKALDHAPIAALTLDDIYETAVEVHETLGSMLVTARAERQLGCGS